MLWVEGVQEWMCIKDDDDRLLGTLRRVDELLSAPVSTAVLTSTCATIIPSGERGEDKEHQEVERHADLSCKAWKTDSCVPFEPRLLNSRYRRSQRAASYCYLQLASPEVAENVRLCQIRCEHRITAQDDSHIQLCYHK